jgi:23S rRNA (cytidine1920-2'-O)/16S rRNA (cytidine1409-2'-O)-methyltransferase
VVVLVKPQFEVGRGQVGRGGIVRDRGLHLLALGEVARGAQALGFGLRGATSSPITGAEGNREFFLHLAPDGPVMPEDGLLDLLRKVVEP